MAMVIALYAEIKRYRPRFCVSMSEPRSFSTCGIAPVAMMGIW